MCLVSLQTVQHMHRILLFRMPAFDGSIPCHGCEILIRVIWHYKVLGNVIVIHISKWIVWILLVYCEDDSLGRRTYLRVPSDLGRSKGVTR